MTKSSPSRNEHAVETVGGKNVLFVMAAHAEYGDELKRRIRPLMTGVGPIEAALHTGIALQMLESRGQRPDLVVSLGSAGSRTLEQSEVYQVASVSWRDIDASLLGFTKGVTPFLDHPVETPLPTPIDGVPAARLSTGADIVSGIRYDAIDADMVDMETFAVLRACQRFAAPLVGLRGISDGASDLHHYDDWATLLHVIDAKLAGAIDRLETALEAAAPRP
ncbi:5'-methylthioadenosine/S-adenosylhomocysteine nucleosidase [Jiella avicenniae]|uniref:5'-methylthioadenosine/S-adenosylhomocysteine nucleosidase n=1 Tax=Jiella avicenniae TaxID=2907202 RepID=A0A9X1TBV7_9HYPH|nr:5'-methylthioadenosine/S-adenosylhomocysteine nucleosidase [Jiella avicenniae]MCE7028423.1 5'-methylthioadenosine/S-adenosylhomocysteine nucleosidase [Jiella avicenniae]